MSTSPVSRRTSTPDAASGHLFVLVPNQPDGAALLPVGLTKQDSLGNKPVSHRSSITAVDTATDMSTGDFASGLFQLNNDGTLFIWAEGDTTGETITVAPIYYAADNKPLFEGTPITFLASTRRVAAGGDFLTALHDAAPVPGAMKVKLYVTALSGGSWSLFLGSI